MSVQSDLLDSSLISYSLVITFILIASKQNKTYQINGNRVDVFVFLQKISLFYVDLQNDLSIKKCVLKLKNIAIGLLLQNVISVNVASLTQSASIKQTIAMR